MQKRFLQGEIWWVIICVHRACRSILRSGEARTLSSRGVRNYELFGGCCARGLGFAGSWHAHAGRLKSNRLFDSLAPPPTTISFNSKCLNSLQRKA